MAQASPARGSRRGALLGARLDLEALQKAAELFSEEVHMRLKPVTVVNQNELCGTALTPADHICGRDQFIGPRVRSPNAPPSRCSEASLAYTTALKGIRRSFSNSLAIPLSMDCSRGTGTTQRGGENGS